MKHTTTPQGSRKQLVAIGLFIYVLLAMVAIAGLWTVRSYARDRDRDDREITVYGFDEDTNQFSYALIGEQTTAVDLNRDWKDIQRLGRKYGKDVFWFSIDDDEYVVVDDDVIEHAREIVEPMTKLGAEQGRLGAMQGRLGARQGAIGARQGQLGAKQGLLGARLAMLSASDRKRAERDAIEDEMEALGRRMEELGRQMEPLGREQEELGRRQEALGERMGKLSKRVKHEMRELAEASIEDGTAKRTK